MLAIHQKRQITFCSLDFGMAKKEWQNSREVISSPMTHVRMYTSIVLVVELRQTSRIATAR